MRGLAATALVLSLTACTTGSDGADDAESATHTASAAEPTETASATTPSPTATTPTTSPTATQPTTSATPLPDCPEIEDLDIEFAVEKIGTANGVDVVEVVMTYTNPAPHALFLMGSIGYLDPDDIESDLFTDPGGLVFDDARLEKGTGTLTRELEDPRGEAVGADLHFTYWTVAGNALDSSRPLPCESVRGHFSR